MLKVAARRRRHGLPRWSVQAGGALLPLRPRRRRRRSGRRPSPRQGRCSNGWGGRLKVAARLRRHGRRPRRRRRHHRQRLAAGISPPACRRMSAQVGLLVSRCRRPVCSCLRRSSRRRRDQQRRRSAGQCLPAGAGCCGAVRACCCCCCGGGSCGCSSPYARDTDRDSGAS